MSNIETQIANIEKQMLELKASLDNLKQTKEKEDSKQNSLLHICEDDYVYYIANQAQWTKEDCIDCIFMDEGALYNYHSKDGNLFPTEQIAKDYAKALNTMLLLRRCEGTIPATSSRQYVIRYIDNEVWVDSFNDFGAKVEMICPCFDTQENTEAAIEQIGKDNIIRMFKTFHGIYE